MKLFLGSVLIVLLLSCQAPTTAPKKLFYPDISSYFHKEIQRLQEAKPSVEKTIHINKQKETKRLSSINWEEELSLFIESDINKPAFEGLYRIKAAGNEFTYSALDEKLKTREVKITYNAAAKIERIAISNHNKNSLYSADEFLEYRPDTLYQIVKRQEVLILGTNNYWIQGEFKK